MATFGTVDPYVKSGLSPLAGGVATVSNLSSGGSIGAMDNYSVALVNQTTSSQTLTIPDLVDSVPVGKTLIVCNVGSATFTMLGLSVTADHGIIVVWDGDEWNVVGKGF